MKKILNWIALCAVVVFSTPTMAQNDNAQEPSAQTAPAGEAAQSAPAPATEPATAAAPADAAAPAAAPAPTPNKGDTAWMLTATVLVILMTIPGLALFYGGMVRVKSSLSMLMQVFTVFALMAILWAIFGYSLAFTQGNAFFGSFDRLFLKGVTMDSTVATWSKGVVIPEYAYIAFQCTFAAITPALILGAISDRIKFSSVLLFMVLWFTFAYLPMAHMVWYWAGPDAYTDAAAGEAAAATAGFLFQKGAIDFAGGTVVHINAGIAGLVAALVLGKRLGYGKEAMPPHSLTMTMIGASLLWVGWFGFNVGSNLEATGTAALAFCNTVFATAAAALAWTFGEWIFRGKPTMLGAASGAVAGLVAVTPACGFIGPMGAIVLGIVAGLVCLWAVVWLKSKLGYDDSLDVFGVRGVGGIVGALGTGILASPSLGGTGVYDYVANAFGQYSIATQFGSQLWAVGTAIVWSGVVTFVALKITDVVLGLRVTEEEEREGLDETQHGERAYYM
jgi:Amt family ammonium transporter